MATTFSDDHLFGLKAAYDRQQQGVGTPEDTKNLEYAQTQGWAPSGSLTGTLEGESSSGERTLGSQKSELQSFTDLLKQSSRSTFAAGGSSPTEILKKYAASGVKLTNPSVIAGATNLNTQSRAARLGDIYSSTMSTIKEKQELDNEYNQNLINGIAAQAPSFLTSITKDEFAILRAGLPFTPEMEVKLKTAQAEFQASEQTANAPTSYQEWQLAGGQAGTGKTYAEYIAKSSGGGGGTTDEETSGYTKNEFIQAYISSIGSEFAMSPDINNPAVAAEIDALYSEYLASIGQSEESEVRINGVSMTEEEASALILTDDRRDMVSKGLDPNDINDIKTYLESSNDEEESTSSGREY
jgi:hypothetical protein